ncbi:hypothetical protein [Novosphingobium endophyticum]|uniref:hypothetical protein n=1 Tax=Novosphingobium endophyticum TaxID=1955250 RepID=UPI001668B4B3|nr:hypothetical protein [Novosphingobium endophyticum]
MALNDTAIRNAKPKEKPYTSADSQGPASSGQSSKGGRLWRIMYALKLTSLWIIPENEMMHLPHSTLDTRGDADRERRRRRRHIARRRDGSDAAHPTWATMRARYRLGSNPCTPHDNILAGAALT